MEKYKATVQYTPDLIRKAEKVINKTFYYKNNMIRIVFCIACMIIGGYVQQLLGTTMMFIGAVILAAGNMNGKRRAERIIEALNGEEIKMSYSFHTDEVFGCVAQGNKSIYPYASLIRLLEDSEFFYLFTGKDQIFVIRKNTISSGRIEEFKKFMTQKTGLEWTKPVILFTLNIRQLLFNKENTKCMGR